MPQRLGYDVTRDPTTPVSVRPASTTTASPNLYTTPTGTGLPQSFVDQYNLGTAAQLASIQQQYAAQISAAGAGSGAQRAGLQDRLRFGLAGIDLQREGLGLDRQDLGLAREGLGLQQQSADLNRRDALEAVINNALQRGIYRSGIRIRNEQRAGERADITDAQLGLQGQGLDIEGQRLDLRGEQLDLNAEELRASIKNALASLNAQASAQRQVQQAQLEAAQFQLEMQRRQALDQSILDFGGVFSDASVRIDQFDPFGGAVIGGPR